MSDDLIPLPALQHFKTVAGMLNHANVREVERARLTHERFNVFTTLLKAEDEVRLHTRFIHCLLDPKGLHDCGSLFLDLFLKMLSGLERPYGYPVILLPISDHPWQIRKETRSDHGQIDLLLERPGVGIAIENKIHAGEQDDQLTRYAAYLAENHGEGGTLIYLTLDGKPSATGCEISYLRLSYAEHILDWLENCLHETYRIIPVNQVILQYRDVIRQLTGKTFAKNAMKQTADFIQRNPDIIRYQPQIANAIQMVRADLLDRLAAGMITDLKERGYTVVFRDNLREKRFSAEGFGAFIITPKEDSVLRQSRFEIWVEHNHCNSLYVGIKFPNGGYRKTLPAEGQELLERMRLFLDQDAESLEDRERFPNDAWPTGWRRLIDPLDAEHLADLLGMRLDLVAADLTECISQHIQALERAYVSSTSTSPIKIP